MPELYLNGGELKLYGNINNSIEGRDSRIYIYMLTKLYHNANILIQNLMERGLGEFGIVFCIKHIQKKWLKL